MSFETPPEETGSMYHERSVCFTHQQTAIFRFEGNIAGPDAVLLGDVDNDPLEDEELVIGSVDGDLAVFRGSQQPEPCMKASGLGTITAIALGPLFLGSPGQQLIVCSAEGCLHIFDLRDAHEKPPAKQASSAGADSSVLPTALEIRPIFSLTCPCNVSCVAVADVSGHERPEVCTTHYL
jgi:Integrin-alpha FG-GAP repeat-containing protein 2